MAFYTDMSGTSMVQGTFDQSGKFQLRLASSMGNGPVADVQGTKNPDGSINATLKGAGCANGQIKFEPVRDLNELHG
jgi:hypothetical protein